MQNWTTRRRASLIIHALVVLIPFVFSAGSAALFWYSLFRSWWVAGSLVTVIDGLALLGLVLFICRVPSPFQALRHVLPFVSVVPLGYELLTALSAHNNVWLSAIVSGIVTAVMVAVAWQCFRTIEQLFVDPLTAAMELAEEKAERERLQVAQVSAMAQQSMAQQVMLLSETLAGMSQQQQLAVSAIQEWVRQPQLQLTAAQPVVERVKVLSTQQATQQQVRSYADSLGVSERTIYRRLKAGELTHADIIREVGDSNDE
jgi:hypothetical protein